MRVSIADEYFRNLGCVDLAEVPAGRESLQVILVAVSEEEDVLSEVVLHKLEVVNSDVRVREQTHIIINN